MFGASSQVLGLCLACSQGPRHASMASEQMYYGLQGAYPLSKRRKPFRTLPREPTHVSLACHKGIELTLRHGHRALSEELGAHTLVIRHKESAVAKQHSPKHRSMPAHPPASRHRRYG